MDSAPLLKRGLFFMCRLSKKIGKEGVPNLPPKHNLLVYFCEPPPFFFTIISFFLNPFFLPQAKKKKGAKKKLWAPYFLERGKVFFGGWGDIFSTYIFPLAVLKKTFLFYHKMKWYTSFFLKKTFLFYYKINGIRVFLLKGQRERFFSPNLFRTFLCVFCYLLSLDSYFFSRASIVLGISVFFICFPKKNFHSLFKRLILP